VPNKLLAIPNDESMLQGHISTCLTKIQSKSGNSNSYLIYLR
jgi:hypothetical protein